MKTPSVYIVEKNAFPNSVVEAPTAIPAFIGITETALNGTESLSGKPWKITSLTEYHKYFGGAPAPRFELSIVRKEGTTPTLEMKVPELLHTFYYNLRMFFANGGSTCYIVSVGTYSEHKPLSKDAVEKAITALRKEVEVTLLVVPEAVNVPECKDIQQAMLMHCGIMQNRFAILDVPQQKAANETMDMLITRFREEVGSNNLSYGAAYYPWLNTSILADSDITDEMFAWGENTTFDGVFDAGSQLLTYANANIASAGKEFHNAMMQNWEVYHLTVKKAKEQLNLLPPSAAIAGLYSMVDNSRGVWKAPANYSLTSVNSLAEIISNEQQEELNMPMNGKAVNAIRSFTGDGIKVWGARTLDGNSQDWRYVNVRRTLIFLEESVKNAARAYVFEPNDASTWLNMKCMIENFLTSVWKRGGLAGSVPEDAFSVHVGLGETMTPEDILNGILRITVLVAVVRPAEFIEITFQQQQQRS
jgi:phage tail sheath protein FI